jgi:hypothetical protein
MTVQLVAGEGEAIVLEIPGIPEDVIEFLFNVNHGTHIDRYCQTEGSVTDQVVISYSQLGLLKRHEVERVVGRIMDVVPGTRFFLGKPTLCRCGTLNR